MKKRSPNSEIDQIVERRRTVEFWLKHICRLRNEGLVDSDTLQLLINLGVTNTKNIGHKEGQIRPGQLGRQDVFCRLSGQTNEINRLLLSDLSSIEVAEMMRDFRLLSAGVDPDNPQEVGEFRRIQSMSHKEVETLFKAYYDSRLNQLLEDSLAVND